MTGKMKVKLQLKAVLDPQYSVFDDPQEGWEWLTRHFNKFAQEMGKKGFELGTHGIIREEQE